MDDSKEQLNALLGEDTATKVLKLQKKCDNYLIKFKKEMNKLLKPHGHEVLCGVAFKRVEEESKQ